jgi:hypothetical protein
MLQTLIFDVADVEFGCYRHVILGVVSRGGGTLMLDVSKTLIFNIANVVFRCCRHVMLDVVSRRRREEVS